MKRLNQPTRLRIYINTTDLSSKERITLSNLKSDYRRSIIQEINTGHLILKNNGEGTYLIKKLKDKFGNRVWAYAETVIEKSDLPDEIQEAKLWKESLKDKKLMWKD